MSAVDAKTNPGEAGAPPKRRRFRAFVIGIAVAALLFAGGFFWFVRLVPADDGAALGKADGIVALTGGAARISDALHLLATGHGKRLLISGVNPITKSEEILASMPEHQRWFDCCVDLGYSATNTIGNAAETRLWVKNRGFKSLIVVTSNFHMPRAMAELSHQLPDIELTPSPVVSERVRDAWWSNSSKAKILFSEYLKYIVAVARTRLSMAVQSGHSIVSS